MCVGICVCVMCHVCGLHVFQTFVLNRTVCACRVVWWIRQCATCMYMYIEALGRIFKILIGFKFDPDYMNVPARTLALRR